MRSILSLRKAAGIGRLGLVLAAGLSLAAPARADTDTVASYVINLAGINIASAKAHFTVANGQYGLDISADVSGLGTLVARGSAQADSKGQATGKGLAANGFDLKTEANGEDFSVAVQYARGDATGFQVAPPVTNTMGRVPIERKDMKGVADPIGSFVLKGGSLSPDLCKRTLKVFTGLERYDIDMSFGALQNATSERTGYQGPVALCRLRYKPISGHYKQSEMTNYLANSDKILVWYMPLAGTDYFIPYRVLMGTSAGDLSMVLTHLN